MKKWGVAPDIRTLLYIFFIQYKVHLLGAVVEIKILQSDSS